jgi:hypothetical protein
MSTLDSAMKNHMENIVKIEGRPFCVLDFNYFEIEGNPYHVDSGTFRNKISDLTKKREVIFQYRSTYAYYSLPGYDFRKDKTITQDHAGLPLKLARQTPLYKLLKDRPLPKQALHDIRLTFSAHGIWDIFSKIFPHEIDNSNKDIRLESSKFFNEIDVGVTVHHTDMASISIACSSRPIAIDIPDLFYLVEILTRTEIKIANYFNGQDTNLQSTSIPRYTSWVVKMWHFGIDIVDEYDREAFHVTFQEGISDLWRIYTKRLKDGKLQPRVEHQEYPNKPIMEAVLDKIYSEGFD